MLYTISFALFSQTVDSQEIRSPLIDANDVCSSGSDNIGSIPIEIDSDYQYSCASCCSNGLIENIRDQSEVSKWNFNNCGSSTSNPNGNLIVTAFVNLTRWFSNMAPSCNHVVKELFK